MATKRRSSLWLALLVGAAFAASVATSSSLETAAGSAVAEGPLRLDPDGRPIVPSLRVGTTPTAWHPSAGAHAARVRAHGAPPIAAGVFDLSPLGFGDRRKVVVDSAGNAGSAGGLYDWRLATQQFPHAMFGPPHGTVDLGGLRVPLGYSAVRGVSPNGAVIVGDSERASGQYSNDTNRADWHAVVWVAGVGSALDLGSLAPPGVTDDDCYQKGAILSRARAANNSGVIVGGAGWKLQRCDNPTNVSLPGNPYFMHAFRTGQNGMEDLGTFNDGPGGTGTMCAYSTAAAVNANGAIVGAAGSERWGGLGVALPSPLTGPCSDAADWTPHLHAFLLPAGGVKGEMVDLGNPALGTGANDFSYASDINDAGAVTLNGLDNAGHMHGFVRSGSGAIVDVGSLGGETVLDAINNNGDAVGYSTTDNTATAEIHAVLWRDGTLYDLVALTGSRLGEATDINDAGDIVGWAAPTGCASDDPTCDSGFLLRLALYADIQTGPPGSTDARNAAFEFSSSPAAPYECSLDGSAFAPCTSPKSYAGLAEGDHAFRVRTHLALHDPGPNMNYYWTIQTAAPAVVIDTPPPANTASGGTVVAFHGTQDGLTFTCRWDAEPPYSCLSPATFVVGVGTHTFAVSGTNQFGQTSTVATAVWTVQDEPSPLPARTSGCVAPDVASATSGNMVMVGRSGTCLKDVVVGGVHVWRATGPVSLNGLLITPAAGQYAELTTTNVNGNFKTSGASTLTVGSWGPVPIPVPLWFDEQASAKLKLMRGPADAICKAWAKGAGDNTSSIPIKCGTANFAVWPKITLSPANGGSLAVTLLLSLPAGWSDALANNQVGGEFTVTFSNEVGPRYGGKLKVGEVKALGMTFKDLELGYDDALRQWDFGGTLMMSLGPEPTTALSPEVEVRIEGSLSRDAPATWGYIKRIAVSVQKINRPLPVEPPVLFLQKIGGEIAFTSGVVNGVSQVFPTIKGNLGISVGPYVTWLKSAPLSLDGGFAWALSTPKSLEVSSAASLFQFPIARSKLKVITDPLSISLTGDVELTVFGFGFIGSLGKSYFQGVDQFTIEETGDLILPLLRLHGQGISSNKGIAACASMHGAFGDYAFGWGEMSDGTVLHFADVCDLAPLRSIPAPVSRYTGARRAGGAWPLALAAHAGPRLIVVRGSNLAPDVTVTGPGGVHLSVSHHTSGLTANGLVVVDDAARTTYLLLPRSPAGTYSLTSTNGLILGVQTADSLTPVKVKATTRPIAGGKRLLTFSQVPVAGQVLEIYEQGAGSSRLLLRTTARSGSLRYRPALGLGARRSIRLVTLRKGLARAEQTTATYTVVDKAPARVAKVHLKGRVLTWAVAARATGYLVSYSRNGLAFSTLTTRAHRLTLPAGVVVVAVAGRDAIGRLGPPTTVKIKPARK
jgi:probable HAF family extracellular repeat protein